MDERIMEELINKQIREAKTKELIQRMDHIIDQVERIHALSKKIDNSKNQTPKQIKEQARISTFIKFYAKFILHDAKMVKAEFTGERTSIR